MAEKLGGLTGFRPPFQQYLENKEKQGAHLAELLRDLDPCASKNLVDRFEKMWSPGIVRAAKKDEVSYLIETALPATLRSSCIVRELFEGLTKPFKILTFGSHRFMNYGALTAVVSWDPDLGLQ